MSLILEALRKSEAERRRATVPDLLAEPAVAAPIATTPRQRWPWFVGGAAVVALLAWFAMRDRAPAPIEVVPVTKVEAPAPRVEAKPAQTQPAPVPQRPLVVATPAPPPKPAPAAPVIDTPPAHIEPLRAPAPPPVAIDTTERVADLGAADRKQLPPLKLSMHMWNDDAAQRFVIIDGARLRVGEHVGNVTVADIVPDGVLLDWNGRTLKLPLP